MRVAACSCGQLSVACEGESVRISICHCLECQRRTGSAFGVQARFPRSHVNIAGNSSKFTRVGDSGTSALFHFCPTCGSTVCWESGEFIAVAVGNFADPNFPAPTVSVYEERQHKWCKLEGVLEHID